MLSPDKMCARFTVSDQKVAGSIPPRDPLSSVCIIGLRQFSLKLRMPTSVLFPAILSSISKTQGGPALTTPPQRLRSCFPSRISPSPESDRTRSQYSSSLNGRKAIGLFTGLPFRRKRGRSDYHRNYAQENAAADGPQNQIETAIEEAGIGPQPQGCQRWLGLTPTASRKSAAKLKSSNASVDGSAVCSVMIRAPSA